ncbi:MAG: heavy-metal-associated domain-containing protein [Nitrospirae bacterium]|nr:heavy-metal-associated domain-containing protein [Nitrospirota bacterium]
MENTKLSLQVEGISCTGCAMDIETVLSNWDGILKVTVGYATETIDVEYNPAEIDSDKILSAVKRMGLKIKVL